MARIGGACLVALAVACGPATERLDLPLSSGTRSLILLVRRAGSAAPEIFAAGTSTAAGESTPLLIRRHGREALQLTLLEYSAALSDLGLAARGVDGSLEPAPKACRPIPLPDRAQQNGGDGWSAISPAEAVPALPLLACLMCGEARHDNGSGVCARDCAAGYHDGGNGGCVARGKCVEGFHDDGKGSCAVLGSCALGFRNGGDGVCVPEGTCSVGFHDGGDGACVSAMSCKLGFHDDGLGTCVLLPGRCAPGFHDGGDGACRHAGSCSTGYHDGGDGSCLPLGTCVRGYRDGGDGSCTRWGSCAPMRHDDGLGVCVGTDQCARGFHLDPAHDCVSAVPGFVPIPAGSFTMGAPANEPGRTFSENQHRVTITRDFFLQASEVSQAEWVRAMGGNPSHHQPCDACPVERVSWQDAAAFANARSRSEGLPECYGGTPAGDTFVGLSCRGYRLPTEAEWEYAARAGTTGSAYTGSITHLGCAPLEEGLDAGAWYCGNSGSVTQPVRQKAPNAWGLYDMLGNTWEWVHDRYQPLETFAVVDPLGANLGETRVYRGGGADSTPEKLRSAARYNVPSAVQDPIVGFRLARTM